jgi:LAO/AO transport system kinase
MVSRVARGDVGAIARMISRAETGTPEARDALAAIYRLAGQAHVIGVTGVPGSGKSTLVGALTAELRALGRRVGVVAVDPSSPYSGGSILGDRIRMADHVCDDGVYIRSMATHGAVGGLARAALDAVDILDVAGFDTVILETVGVGQDEVEIARASDTIIVVSAPGLGDDVQAIKAGMLEIADIHVVSKCDRADANRTLSDLKHMLAAGMSAVKPGGWITPVVAISAYDNQGFDQLHDAIRAHLAKVVRKEPGLGRRREIARFRLEKTAQDLLVRKFMESTAQEIKDLSSQLVARDSDPYSLAKTLIAAILQGSDL